MQLNKQDSSLSCLAPEHSIREPSTFWVFFTHWMHKYNKGLRSGLGCSSSLWRNGGDWRCMCPGIGTDRDPSSPNYPHSIDPCGTLCLNIYGYSHTHGHTHIQMRSDTHKPLNVTSCRRLYQWAISCSLASSGRTKLAENKSIFNNMRMWKSLGRLQSSIKRFNQRSTD